MQDVKFTQDKYGRFDLDIADGDFIGEDSYDTAIWISLFTDARADSSQVATPEYRRGWMGNLVAIVPDRQLGGLLWLVDQRRLIQKTLNEAVDYSNKALQWMVTDGVCTEITVDGVIVPKTGIELDVNIISTIGVVSTKNIKLWEVTGR